MAALDPAADFHAFAAARAALPAGELIGRVARIDGHTLGAIGEISFIQSWAGLSSAPLAEIRVAARAYVQALTPLLSMGRVGRREAEMALAWLLPRLGGLLGVGPACDRALLRQVAIIAVANGLAGALRLLATPVAAYMPDALPPQRNHAPPPPRE